jgi:hypothetical protein
VMNLALVAHNGKHGTEWDIAESALQSAIEIMNRRMQHINVARIASWRPNPTAYR